MERPSEYKGCDECKAIQADGNCRLEDIYTEAMADVQLQYLLPSLNYVCKLMEKPIQSCTTPSMHIQSCTTPSFHIQSCTTPSMHIQSCTTPSMHIQSCTRLSMHIMPKSPMTLDIEFFGSLCASAREEVRRIQTNGTISQSVPPFKDCTQLTRDEASTQLTRDEASTQLTRNEAREMNEQKNFNTHAKLCDICKYDGHQATQDMLGAARRNTVYPHCRTVNTVTKRQTKYEKRCCVGCKTCGWNMKPSCPTVSFKEDDGDMPDYVGTTKRSNQQKLYVDFSGEFNERSNELNCKRTSEIFTADERTKSRGRVVCEDNFTSNASSSSPAILDLMSAGNATSLHVRRPTVYYTSHARDAGDGPTVDRHIEDVHNVNATLSNASMHDGNNHVIPLVGHHTSNDNCAPVIPTFSDKKYPVESSCSESTDGSSNDETNDEIISYMSTSTELNVNSSSLSINSNNELMDHTNVNLNSQLQYDNPSTNKNITENTVDYESDLSSSETICIIDSDVSNNIIHNMNASGITNLHSEYATESYEESASSLDVCSINSNKFNDNEYDSTLIESISDFSNMPDSECELISLSNTADMCMATLSEFDDNHYHSGVRNQVVSNEYSDTSSDGTLNSDSNNIVCNENEYTSNLFLNPSNRQIIPLGQDLTNSSNGECVSYKCDSKKDIKSKYGVTNVTADQWTDLTNSDERIHGGNRTSHNYPSSETSYQSKSTAKFLDPRYNVFNTTLVHTLTGTYLRYDPSEDRHLPRHIITLPLNVSSSSPGNIGHLRVISSLLEQTTANSLPLVSDHFRKLTKNYLPINLCKSMSSPARPGHPRLLSNYSTQSMNAGNSQYMEYDNSQQKSQSEFYDLSSTTSVQSDHTNNDVQPTRDNNSLDSITHSARDKQNKISQTDFYNLHSRMSNTNKCSNNVNVNHETGQFTTSSPERKLKSNLTLQKGPFSSNRRGSLRPLSDVNKKYVETQQEELPGGLIYNNSNQCTANISELVDKSNFNLRKHVIRPHTIYNPLVQTQARGNSEVSNDSEVQSDNELLQSNSSINSIPVEVWGARSVNRGLIQPGGIVFSNKSRTKIKVKLKGTCNDNKRFEENLSEVVDSIPINGNSIQSQPSQSVDYGSIATSHSTKTNHPALIGFATIPFEDNQANERSTNTSPTLNKKASQTLPQRNMTSSVIQGRSPPTFSVTLSSGLKLPN